jgi:hypothetical protein
MAKQIIALETNPSDGGYISLTIAMWFPVPAGREVTVPSLTKSAWTGASAAEIQALQLGTVKEEVNTFRFPSSYSAAQIKAELQASYTARLAYLNSLPFQGQYYGVFFDGTVWSA